MTRPKGDGAGSSTEAEFTPGKPVVVTSESPSTSFGAVFEDDGETGYFYAMDTSKQDGQILDGLHVYNVVSVVDRHLPSLAQVRWSTDGMHALLLINAYPHAAFDFTLRRGYCRTNFPAPSAGGFSAEGHEWSDDVLAFFK